MAGPLASRVAALSDAARREALLRAVGEAWAEEANARAPDGPPRPADTSAGVHTKLKGGITFEVEGPTRGYLVLPAQARYLIAGTQRHAVAPRAGRSGRNRRPAALQFAVGGVTFYRRRVFVRGITPRPFVWQAWRSARVQDAVRAAGIALVSRA